MMLMIMIMTLLLRLIEFIIMTMLMIMIYIISDNALFQEHVRLVISGPSGRGKTHLFKRFFLE